MRKYVYVLFSLVLAFAMLGCQSKESKGEKAKNKVMANKEEFIRILRATGRPGIDTVISHLDTTDFFTRPAGRHHTEEGGLVQHSLEVYRIMRVIAWFQPSDRIAVTALLHDMGKIDYGGWHPWRSVKLLGEWGFELTDKEYYAIFYHHKPRYHSRLRITLTVSDAISTGWWKLWHKSPEITTDEAPDGGDGFAGSEPE